MNQNWWMIIKRKEMERRNNSKQDWKFSLQIKCSALLQAENFWLRNSKNLTKDSKDKERIWGWHMGEDKSDHYCFGGSMEVFARYFRGSQKIHENDKSWPKVYKTKYLWCDKLEDKSGDRAAATYWIRQLNTLFIYICCYFKKYYTR